MPEKKQKVSTHYSPLTTHRSPLTTHHSTTQGLLAEINNGRLAMIGIMAFMAEAKLPGAVPGLVGKV
jgi:hypothetical protein